MMSETLPPTPPDEDAFEPGKFNYIKNKGTRDMLQNAYQAITLTETWEFVKKDIDTFMFSSGKEISIITSKMTDLGFDNHTGFTFGWTLRQMQFIAKNGESEFMKYCKEN